MQANSLELFPPQPLDTAKAAQYVFGKNNFFIATGEEANNLFSGLVLEAPAGEIQLSKHTSAMLHLITIFQYLEALPDCQAADALRERLDWKFALHLPLYYSGLDASKFCDFRQMLLADSNRLDTLQTVISRLSEMTQETRKGRILKISKEVVVNVCLQNRLAIVWDTIREALGVLATRQPEWLRNITLPQWYERYGFRQKSLNLAADNSELEVFTQVIGVDGQYLLNVVAASNIQALMDLPEITTLKQVWQMQFGYLKGETPLRIESCNSCSLSRQPQGLIKQVNWKDQEGFMN